MQMIECRLEQQLLVVEFDGFERGVGAGKDRGGPTTGLLVKECGREP